MRYACKCNVYTRGIRPIFCSYLLTDVRLLQTAADLEIGENSTIFKRRQTGHAAFDVILTALCIRAIGFDVYTSCTWLVDLTSDLHSTDSRAHRHCAVSPPHHKQHTIYKVYIMHSMCVSFSVSVFKRRTVWMYIHMYEVAASAFQWGEGKQVWAVT